MLRFATISGSVIDIFTNLCLSQVKEQLTENLLYFNPNPPSFIYNGHLFTFSPNQTFISSEPFPGCELNLKFNHCHN